MKNKILGRMVVIALIMGSGNGLSADEGHPFAGSWAAPCTFFGNEAQCAVVWRTGLHPDVAEMHYTVSVPGAEAQIMFQGKSVLKRVDHSYRGFWSDSTGAIHPVIARLDGQAMESEWGEAETEQGRSRYELLDSGQLQITDWVLAEGDWRTFMDVTYERVSP